MKPPAIQTIRIASAIAAFFALVVIGQPGAAGAAADEVIELPFEVYTIDHDPTTDTFIVEHAGERDTPCGRRALSVIERNGEISWQVPNPVPCTWLVHDGELFVASANTIRFFDLATGELIREWVLDETITVREMFRGGPTLWFNTLTDVGRIRRDSGVGSLSPGVQDSVGISFPDMSLLAIAGEGRFLYLQDETFTLTRFDQGGQTDQIEMATTNALNSGWTVAHITADEQLLYIGGGQSVLLDAETLEELSEPNARRQAAVSFDDLSNGGVLGIGGDGTPGVGVARLFAQGTLDPIASGPSIAGIHSANTDAVVVTDPGFGDRLAVAAGNRIEIHSIGPSLGNYSVVGGPNGSSLEAGTPTTIRLGVDWIDAIETVSVNGQVVPSRRAYDPFGGWLLGLDVDLPALPAGTHLIEFDGPLGRSADSASNRITVLPAQARSDLELLVRSDSSGGEVNVSVACIAPNAAYDAVHDINTHQVMRADSRFTVRPLIGHTCSIHYERAEGPGLPLGYFDYLTGGFFDPVTDPEASGMFDVNTRAVDVTIGPSPTGFAVFLPHPDEVVLWTYAYGFGQAPEGERTVTVDCEGTANDATYRIFYGYWYRSVVPARGCLVTHPAPDGSVFSGWGDVHIETRQLGTVPNDSPQRGLGAAGALATLFTLDVYPHPSEHNGAFVRQQYLDFLGRQGDPGGLQHWEGALNNGSRARTDLVQLFLDSPEFGGTVAPVNRLYSAYFDRAPDREGLFFWVNWVRSGRSLIEVSDEFARSPEFDRMYGALSDEDFIDLVYQNVLGRLPDAGGRAFWVDQMERGFTRGELMLNFSESVEYIDQTRSAVLVESLYQGLLQRSPDPQGFAFWTGQVDAGASIDSLIAGMLASDEYYNRFDNIIDELPVAAARTQQRLGSAPTNSDSVPTARLHGPADLHFRPGS